MRKLLEQAWDEYQREVELDFTVDGIDTDVEVASKVLLKYTLEIDYRSWGIRDIVPSFAFPVTITYLIEGEEKERTVVVDLKEADISFIEGDAWTPLKLNVRVDKDGKVLSKEIDMAFIHPSR